MSQNYLTSPPPNRGRARVGVESFPFNDFTPIPTFPLKWGRSHAIAQAPSPASKLTCRRGRLRYELMHQANITFPPLVRGRARVGVKAMHIHHFTPIPTFPLKGGRSCSPMGSPSESP